MRTPASAALVTALTGVLLAGCSSPSTSEAISSPSASTPVTSASAAPSASSSSLLQDQSADVIGRLPELTPVATTKASSTSSFASATFTIYSLRATSTSTVLTYTITYGPESDYKDSLPWEWETWPVLVTPPTRVWPVLEKRPDRKEWQAASAPYWGDPPKESLITGPITILYPPLPPDITSVSLQSAWFEKVTVPVTR